MIRLILVTKLSNPCIFDFWTRVASPRPLRGSVMILGHCGLARHCVWSSGAAHAVPDWRRPPFVACLKARTSEVERITR